MTIRSLEIYLNERKLLTTVPLSTLADTRLGIDMTHYLRHLLTSPASREPLVASTGGLPLALITQIEADLKILDRCRIKPVFVFAGLPINQRPPPKGLDPVAEREMHIKRDAWAFYENGRVEQAIATLTGAHRGSWTDYRDVLRIVMRIFRHRMVEYVVAPYMQWAQLAYMLKHPKGYIHSVFSSTEALMFPIDKVITSIDFSASPPTFTFIDKNRVTVDLGITNDQFLDLSILAGSELSRTFPAAAENYAFKSVVDMIKHYKTGIHAVQAWSNHPIVKLQNYGDTFMRVRLAVKYALILTAEEGNCLPLPLVVPPQGGQVVTAADVPGDLQEIFSGRLPDEVYLLLCRGLVSPQLVGWLSSGQIVESQPLDNGDASEYRRFIKDVITEGHTAPRCTALALLASGLHPSWLQKRVNAHYFFDPPHAPPMGANVPFGEVQTKSLVDRCISWHVPCAVVEEELRRQNSSTIDIKLCLVATASDEYAKRTRPQPKVTARPLEKKDEVVANVIWRFLDLRGLHQPNHTHTMMGRALHAAIVSSRINDKFQEALYLALELSRAGVLHGDLWSGTAYSGGPMFGAPEERTSALLIMRCLSIVPLTFRAQQWSGPLSRELLVFNSFVRALSRSLRQLFEAICVHMLLRGEAKRNRDDYVDIALSLPFQTDVNTGFGILAKTYLDATSYHFDGTIPEGQADTPEAVSAKKEALGFLEQSFLGIKNPIQEIERGFRFWDALMVAVRSLAKDQGPAPLVQNVVMQPHVIDQFERADKWLRPMRP